MLCSDTATAFFASVTGALPHLSTQVAEFEMSDGCSDCVRLPRASSAPSAALPTSWRPASAATAATSARSRRTRGSRGSRGPRRPARWNGCVAAWPVDRGESTGASERVGVQAISTNRWRLALRPGANRHHLPTPTWPRYAMASGAMARPATTTPTPQFAPVAFLNESCRCGSM